MTGQDTVAGLSREVVGGIAFLRRAGEPQAPTVLLLHGVGNKFEFRSIGKRCRIASMRSPGMRRATEIQRRSTTQCPPAYIRGCAGEIP